MRRLLLGAALAACVGAWCLPAGAATPAAEARVATGAKITLVASARTPMQWSAKRPQFRDLIPKVRGTHD